MGLGNIGIRLLECDRKPFVTRDKGRRGSIPYSQDGFDKEEEGKRDLGIFEERKMREAEMY